MQLRLPWILSRRRLVFAVILESVLFASLYISLFLHRFGRWPDGSIFLPVLWAIWVVSSYVMGRYQSVDSLRSSDCAFQFFKGFVKTTFVVAFSLSGTLTYLWLFKSNIGDALFRSFLIPYLGSMGLISFLIQSLLAPWLRIKSMETEDWNFLGDREAFNRLKYHLQWSRLPAKIDYLNYSQLNKQGFKSLIIENISAESSECCFPFR